MGNQGDFSAEFIKGDGQLIASCISYRLGTLHETTKTLETFSDKNEEVIQLISDINVEVFQLRRIDKIIFKASVAADCHE